MFLLALFFVKTQLEYNANQDKNPALMEGIIGQESGGLIYGGETLGELVNKDTDIDGVPDWEESLWGTDPNKKDTNDDGTLDSTEIEKLKQQQETNKEGGPLLNNNDEKLTETDKFSRELFSTIATLSQNGELDQASIDKFGSSLAEQVKNSPVQKVFLLSELKIIKDDSAQAVKKYSEALENIYKKHPTTRTVMDVLQDFGADENNVDVSALAQLDPIIAQVKGIIGDFVKTSVPQSLAPLHMEVINGIQRLSENISNIKLFDTDVIVALGAISQYQNNTELLESAVKNLANAINQKLSN